MECPICLNDWNSQTCVPLMLNCGHSFCSQCLTLMLTDPKAKEIKCPNCEYMMPLADKGLSGLIKNYALISLVESKLVMKN
jgi:E3 ubiquitin-protein ligase KEG